MDDYHDDSLVTLVADCNVILYLYFTTMASSTEAAIEKIEKPY